MTKRIISFLLLLVLILGMIPSFAFAASSEEEALGLINIYNGGNEMDYLYINGDVKEQIYVYYNYVNSNGEIREIPAYCVNPMIYGVSEYVEVGESIEYLADSKSSDPKIMGIVANGYPNRGLGELKLKDKYEAYYATKTALWCYILSHWDINNLKVNPNLTGEELEAAERVLAATKDIYRRGTSWNTILSPDITCVPDRDVAYDVVIDGVPYKQQIFTYNSKTWICYYEVNIAFADPDSVPAGTRIVDMENNDITTLTTTNTGNGYGAQFKVLYPVESIAGQQGSVQLNFTSLVYQYAIFYATCQEMDKYEKIQNYMVDTDPVTTKRLSAISNYADSTPGGTEDPVNGDTGLIIRKYETGTTLPLEGVLFEVIGPDGDTVGLFSTNGNGEIVLPLSLAGNYTVTERSAPMYYLMGDNTTQNVTVVYGETAELTFFNNPYGELRIEKKSDTGMNLPGATIRIKHIESGQTYTQTTNVAGTATFSELEPGAYEIVELAAPYGWLKDATVHTTVVNSGETGTYTLINEELPGLRIIKYDRVSQNVMSGVTFEVWKDSVSLGQFETNAMGEILIPNADPGTYLVQEVDTGDQDHILDSTPQQIELAAGDGIRELLFFNDLKPGLRLTKVDSTDPSKVIAGAVFEIKSVDGSFGPEEFVTGQDGSIDLSRLPAGAYVVTEKSCSGYVIDSAQRIIQLDPNENAEFVFTNTVLPSMRIVKLSSDGTPLAGVTFKITRIEDGSHYLDRTTNKDGEINVSGLEPGVYSVQETATVADHIIDVREYHVELFPGQTSELVIENQIRPNLIVYKHDADTGEPIANTVFLVRAADGHSVDEIKTDSEGKAVLKNLLPGVYEIIERSVPAPYLLDAPSQLVTLYPNHDHTVYFENHQKPSLTVNKSCSVTGEPLEGARFRVTYASGNTTTGEINDLGYFYTDENGHFKISDLKDGWYTVTEVESIPGYSIKDPAAQTIYVKGGESKTLIFENAPLSALVVYKYDSITGEAVEGAVFQVKYLTGTSGTGGTVIGTYKTGANGSFTVTRLEAGTYIVEELASDSGHVMNSTPQTAYISGKEQDVVQLYFGNTPKGSVLIKKVDSATREPLSDVEFLVTTDEGTVVGNANGKFVTNSTGSILIEDLAPGTTLVVREIRAKDGYVLDNATQTIRVKGGETVELEFRNAPKGSLIINKVDSITGEPLAGVKFKITYSDGSYVDTEGGKLSSLGLYTTDRNGQIILTDIVGTLVVTEVETIKGYTIDEATRTQTVVVNSDDTQTLTFTNTPNGSLIVVKKDAVTGEPLSGVEFKISGCNGCEYPSGTYTTDSNGMIRLSSLPGGSYTIVETHARAGYLLDDTVRTVKVEAGACKEVTIENIPLGGLLIKKMDSVTKEPLSGAIFKVTTPSGAAAGNTNGEYRTDENGYISIPNLEPGGYVVQEVKAPDGYKLDDTVKTVEVKDDQTYVLEFFNEAYGGLLIKKMDSATHEPLANAVFKITTTDGSVVGNSNGEYRTDENGCISIPDIQPGSYVVQEVKAPDGYLLDNTSQTIEVKDHQTYVLEFFNQPLGSLIIYKVDSITRKPLEGVTFKITYSDGSFVDIKDGKLSSKGLYKTDENGQIIIDNIAGTLVVTEIETIDGYVIDEEARSQTVVVNPDDTQHLTFTNTPKGSLVITKVDSITREPISGVQFKITGKGYSKVVTTDQNGIIRLTGLDDGSYTIVETQAKVGYLLDNTSRTVELKAGTTKEVTFENTPLGGLVIKKLDADTKEPLAGAVFKVTTASGAVVGNSGGEFRTDERGYITIPNLDPGGYIVWEVQAPDGYLLDDSPKTVEITDHQTYTLEFFNQPMGGLIINKLDSVTNEPLAGVKFKVTYADGSNVDNAGGKLSSNGLYTTDKNGQIIINGITGTLLVTEVETINGYTIDKNTRTQTVVVNPNDTQTLWFYNDPIGGLLIIKSDEDTGARIKGAKFEIRKMNGAVVGTYTTSSNGIIYLPNAGSGWYTVTELKAADGYLLDPTSYQIEVKNGETATLEITNAKAASILIHKTDSATGEGIYGVTFVIYDSGKNPIEQIVTDQSGYAYLNKELTAGKYYIRELDAADGYITDTQYQTVYVSAGKTTLVEWENTPVTGQIQIHKYAAEYNSVTGTAAGTPLQGAVYEIINARSGKVVDYITTDARGVAASAALPLGRYQIREVAAPAYWQIDSTIYDVTLEYEGQTIKLSAFDRSASLGVSITKRSNAEVLAGCQMRYDIMVANTSNVDLENFYWHDRIPTDAANATTLTTGTYSFRLNYRILYKTNYSADYQVLASNLLTSNNYSFALNAIPMQAGEIITDIYFDFGTVPVGFQSVSSPTLSVMVRGATIHGYQMVNRADVGGKYQGTWQTAQASWITLVHNLGTAPSLPKTGY